MNWFMMIPVIFIAACTRTPDPVRPIVIDSKPIARPELVLPVVDIFNSRDIKWIIITPENVDEIFSNLKNSGQPVVVFAITQTGYENISINTREALRVILQQQAVINGYKRYYIQTDGSITTHNARQ